MKEIIIDIQVEIRTRKFSKTNSNVPYHHAGAEQVSSSAQENESLSGFVDF
jgi:hypothetical protein